MSEVAAEKQYPAIPKSFWVTIDNHGGLEKKVTVKLEIDGQDDVIYHGYIHDGHVLHSRNLMPFINRAKAQPAPTNPTADVKE